MPTKKYLILLLVPFLLAVGCTDYFLGIDKGLSCDKLSAKEEVQKVLNENTDTIKKLEELSPDTKSIMVVIDSERCQGKADIIIYYGSFQQRKEIKKIIGDTFFGVPYRMINV